MGPGAHHSELGLRLLHQVILLGLADAGEDARLWVEVQHVALETGEEMAKTANTTHSHHTLKNKNIKRDGGEKEDVCVMRCVK